MIMGVQPNIGSVVETGSTIISKQDVFVVIDSAIPPFLLNFCLMQGGPMPAAVLNSLHFVMKPIDELLSIVSLWLSAWLSCLECWLSKLGLWNAFPTLKADKR
jgi:hypothetical protein